MSKTAEYVDLDSFNDRFTPDWLRREFKPLVIAARKRKVDPKNQIRFIEFLRTSRDHKLNWAPPVIRQFARWAGNEYDSFVDDVST